MFGHFPIRKLFYATSVLMLAGIELGAYFYPPIRLGYIVYIPFLTIGIADVVQRKQAIRRNFPILGHGRYLLESIRPEINQYFVESNLDGRPFNRVLRANVYQRAKGALNTHPFGTQDDVYRANYEWINHSLSPTHPNMDVTRVLIGNDACKQPYLASIFNISAMSYGSLSKNAILALNKGAAIGGFYHNTGEGGLSPYHTKHGGAITWQIGTGYFGCRTIEGKFDPEKFAEKAQKESIKMIEIKLSQGAKPGHGGVLPAAKVTPEISEIRGVPMGQDVLSPPFHSAFNTPLGLLQFVQQLRELSGGKPIGFKLCVGHPQEFFGICKAMLQTGIYPDFITIDGAEGGTGAAPLEFSDSIGTPLNEGLTFVHNALVGCGLRKHIRLIASGKVTTAFNLISKIAMGADVCNSARGMMFALGCIQALQCHANTCPTGVATQDPNLVKGLDVGHKSVRVANYHQATLKNFVEILGAAGLSHPSELKPWMIQRRISPTEVKSLAEIYHYLPDGALLGKKIPAHLEMAWDLASPDYFMVPSVLGSPH